MAASGVMRTVDARVPRHAAGSTQERPPAVPSSATTSTFATAGFVGPGFAEDSLARAA